MLRTAARLRGRAAVGSVPATQRFLGDSGVPPNWGQKATGGTGFLGTPANYESLVHSRPLAPDVFGLDGKPHYAFPAVALSSITNRVTGCVLSGVLFGGGLVGLAGDLPAVVELVKSAGPAVVLPLKFAISFPLVYHTLGGFRHMYWDYTQKGIDNVSAELSSKVLFGASFAASVAAAAVQL